ncbi:unnamed protein product [Nippostrongylus brasiliensis]|uniref:SWIM-type domain-containing protein n=1 Tax=Nippostrongylus brasiliensis TaxID=27835 RepID=A0A0N4YCL0_NIPBR|nr:unnamed protein product [Nippostrongylus brasiliensis]
MLVERWHKRVKPELARTKSGVRVDGLVDILINAPPLMEEDRIIKMSRNLNYGRRRLALHHAAHIMAVKVYGNKVDAVKVVGEGRLCVSDKKGHHVKQSTCICGEKINNRCKKGQVCAYAFTYDCVVDSTAGVSCLHVHAAVTVAPNGLLRCDFASDDTLPVAIEREVPMCDLGRSCSPLSTGNDDSLDNLREVEGPSSYPVSDIEDI